MRQVFRSNDFGSGTGYEIAEATVELNFRQAGAIGAALSPTGAAAESGLVGVAEIDRSGLSAEQRDYLAQGQVQDLVQIERLGRDHGHCVQRIQLAVAFADFVFGSFLLGGVAEETLVTFDLAKGIAGGEAALEHGD